MKNDQKVGTGECELDSGERKFLGGILFCNMLREGRDELSHMREEINAMNVFPVPDGDTGDNMLRTINGAVSGVEGLKTDDLSVVAERAAEGMALSARGNSGIILLGLFEGFAEGLGGAPYADAELITSALELGVKRAYGAVSAPTEGTILTVAKDTANHARKNLLSARTVAEYFSALPAAAFASVERGRELLPTLSQANVHDSGGVGLFYILRGFGRASAKVGTDAAQTPKTATKANSKMYSAKLENREPSAAESGFCTEVLIFTENASCPDTEKIKSHLSSLGSSAAALSRGAHLKLHVHTNTPESVMAYAKTLGIIREVKIENMDLQKSEKKK